MKFTWWILSDVLILNFWFLMWRYELCFTGEKMVKVTQASQVHEETNKFQSHQPHSSNGEKHDSDNVLIDIFRWSRCKKPLPQKVMQSVGIPLPLEHDEVLHFNFFTWNFSSYLDVKVWHIFTRILQKKLILSACSYVFLKFFPPSRLTATSVNLNRYWRRILTGRMCNGHKLVFG